ncbi:MAG: hypothetical protein AAF215_17045 [Cyanobacteria bacterium P01_A01_bin.123]
MKVFSAAFLSIVGLMPLLSAVSADTNLTATAAVTSNSQSQNALQGQNSRPQNPLVVAQAEQPPEDLSQVTLNAFFLPWQVEHANFYQSNAISIHNNPTPDDGDVESLYRQALQLAEELLIDSQYQDSWTDEKLQQFRESDLDIWGLDPSCIAECTSPAFVANVEDFLAIAARTETNADDDFFKLVQAYYDYPYALEGQLWGWPTFFQRTWDYGGYSLLGEGKHLELLLQIDQYQQQHEQYILQSYLTTFTQQLQVMRHAILRDILVSANCSGPEQSAIVAELTQILDQVQLNSTERTALQQRIEAFQGASSDIQVNCQELGTCTCEGG